MANCKYEIAHTDVIEWAKNYKGDKFHAIFCDPPYELAFMGRLWDSSGISFQKETWELLRQHLYPGGFLFAFGGTRTFHRIAVAIEDAGFEIRDTISWTQSQGFPKSYNIAKGIEGKLVNGSANWSDWKDLPGERKEGHLGYTKTQAELGYRPDDYTGRGSAFDLDPTTEMAKVWEGFGTALKPSWEPIVIAMNPVDESFVNNALEYSVSGLNIDAGRIGLEENAKMKTAKFIGHNPGTAGHTMGNGWSEQGENIPMWSGKGRWPANFILSHTPNCRIIGEKDAEGYTINRFTDGAKPWGEGAGHEFESEEIDGGKEYIWECDKNCPVRRLGEQSGELGKSQGGRSGHTGAYEGGYKQEYYGDEKPGFGDSGTAARFFYQSDWSYEIIEQLQNADPFYYCAKTSKVEGQIGVDVKNTHPTKKPLSLTSYLSRLLLPPSHYSSNRRILIPFAGSGSEMIGAILAGWDYVLGIELTEEYIPIANARLKFWSGWAEKGYSDPKEIIKLQKKTDKQKSDKPKQQSLFGD